MKFLYLVLAFFLLAALPLHAQKVLQMEKRGKVKTKKFYLGEEIIFRLKGSKAWYNDIMIDIKVEENIIVFSERFVKVSDITMIKKYRRGAKIAEGSLYSFGLSWLGFSLLGTLDGVPLNDLAWKVPTSSVGLGFLIRRIFNVKKYRIGKKRKLRVLDLSFNKNMQLGY